MTRPEPALDAFSLVAVAIVGKDGVVQQFARYRAEEVGELCIQHVGLKIVVHFSLVSRNSFNLMTSSKSKSGEDHHLRISFGTSPSF